VHKDEQAPFGYTGQEIITSVYVKSGQGCFLLTVNNPSDSCYQATGLGTSNVSVSNIGPPDNVCKEISHVEFYTGPTPTDPTPTDVTPTEPTPTDPTPTDPTPTEPTPTEPTPTEPTPTDPTPTDPTPTDPTPTDPTPTDVTPTEPTATDPAETVTPTEPTPTDPTPTDPTATDPAETETPTESVSTPTPPPTLSPPTPPAGTPELILIPETGVDLSIANDYFFSDPWMILVLGLGFVGIGLVFHGVSNQRARNESREIDE
jgi:hypothetical protein